MPKVSESQLEEHVLKLLESEGYLCEHGEAFEPGVIFEPDTSANRQSYRGTFLEERLNQAVRQLNSDIPEDSIVRALDQLRDQKFPELSQENRRVHTLLINGIPVEYQRGTESIHGKVRLIDWEGGNNEWFAVSQFTVVGARKRRPDIVLFLNGIPLVVIELKNAESENANLQSAFNQIQTYKEDIPALFQSNLINVISDGVTARYGSLSAGMSRFMTWRTVDGETLADPKSFLAIETLVRGLLTPSVLIDVLRYFTVFENDGRGLVKKVAGYHQFHAAKKALKRTEDALGSAGRGGVVWHTQGSGKSLLMAFFSGMLVHAPKLGNPTILVLTDRNDLDDQLYGTFSKCIDLFGQTPEKIESVSDLRESLDRQVGGVIFSTIQKFRPDPDGRFDEITNRQNLVVLVDEAHRSQYGFAAKINTDTGEKSYGFAYYLRVGLPNATFVGFTGTPIELVGQNTREVFGDYIDVYDISQAVQDEATVPIHYEGKIVKLTVEEDIQDAIDLEFDDATLDLEDSERQRLARKWSQLEALAGAQKRIDELANLIVEHFERRQQAIVGKAMIVCMSRRICVELYDALAKLRPSWHSDSDTEGKLKIVMTGSASDPEEFRPHVRSKSKLEALANRFRNPSDSFELVIVRDMWLTGFDCPSMHTLYVDKPMRGHNLMQAIARVNRIFENKPAGLIVDTIGIATDLKAALSFYSDKDRQITGVNMEEAVAALEECIEVVRTMFHGFDYQRAFDAEPAVRLRILVDASEHVLSMEGAADEQRTSSRKRFMDAVARLEKAFKLSSGSNEAASVTDEVAFFSSVKITIRKLEEDRGETRSKADIDRAIQRIVDQAVSSTEVVDLLAAAGIKSPDISVLSEEFLAEMQQIPQKHLAVEALRKLLNGEVKTRTRTNVVQQRQFLKQIQDAMTKYHNRVLDTMQLIQELIEIARKLRDEPEDGLNEEEKAFYDALADNESAMKVMGNDKLKLIAAELVNEVRNSVSVDWWRFEQRRNKIRVAIKRLLRKHGYPPDLQESAVKVVVMQAEAISTEISAASR